MWNKIWNWIKQKYSKLHSFAFSFWVPMTMDCGKEACFPRFSRTLVSCPRLSVITLLGRKTARLAGDRSYPRSYCGGLCWTGSCILCGQRVWTRCLMRNWSCHWPIVNTSVSVVSSILLFTLIYTQLIKFMFN